jgi:hypothetical protein
LVRMLDALNLGGIARSVVNSSRTRDL